MIYVVVERSDMSYHVVDPDEVEPMEGRSAAALPIGEAAGLERRHDKIGLRLYTAEPGEQLPTRYHYHDKQVEAFYVIEGPLHVETPDRVYVVETGETFVVEPGNPHRAFNPTIADERVRAFAVGAPSSDDAHAYDPGADE